MMRLFTSSFYQFREKDLVQVYGHELRAGNSLGLAYQNRYGAILVEHVIDKEGAMVVSYTLPKGAVMRSRKDAEISITWNGQKPIIKVTQLIKKQAKVMVLK